MVLIKFHLGGHPILCFQTTDVSKNFTLYEFDRSWPNIEPVMAFCATWHSWEWEGNQIHQWDNSLLIVLLFCFLVNLKLFKGWLQISDTVSVILVAMKRGTCSWLIIRLGNCVLRLTCLKSAKVFCATVVLSKQPSILGTIDLRFQVPFRTVSI